MFTTDGGRVNPSADRAERSPPGRTREIRVAAGCRGVSPEAWARV
ncbi:hypothetical protein PUR57_21955 [Streptomyces sp. JV176]|nr:hypothetical protein [Streptomyces sp. JV176]